MSLLFAPSDEIFRQLRHFDADPIVGAQVSFSGLVRKINHNKTVTHLFYEAYEHLASKLFLDLEKEAKARFFALTINAVHRVGRVEIGQSAVFINVLAKHRHEAFSAARFLIDELKKNLPIWKQEFYEDGTNIFGQQLCCNSYADNELSFEPVKKALLGEGIAKEQLSSSSVLLIGAGGLGCPLAINLAALGLKELHIVDGDKIEAGNLARQFIFSPENIGQNKALVMCSFLKERFPWTEFLATPHFVDKKLLESLLPNYNLIIDCTDCTLTKTLSSVLSIKRNIPYIAASVFREEGEVLSLLNNKAGCFSCFRNNAASDEKCQGTGVFTHACGMVASVAAAKALLILGKAKIAQSGLRLVNSLGDSREIAVQKDELCQHCNSPIGLQVYHDRL